MSAFNGPPSQQKDDTDFILKFALHNLPKGRTALSEKIEISWEPCENGVFKLDETYKTIEQTETLLELDIDMGNPQISELQAGKIHGFNNGSISKRPNSSVSPCKAPSDKRKRIE